MWLPRKGHAMTKPLKTETVEALAKLLHESGRAAVEKRLVYRNDLPVKPFCEWPDLTFEAREGRRLMARFMLDRRRRTTVKALFR